MIIYNSKQSENIFGFENKRNISSELKIIRPSDFKRSTSYSAHSRKSTSSKCAKKKKLTNKNIKFLQLLGLKVKK